MEGEEKCAFSSSIEGNEALYANDLIMPKLWLMQGSSEFVKSREHKHQAGDWVNSLTGEILGGPDEPLNFVVISSNKRWQAFWLETENGKTKKVYTSDYSAPLTMENRNWKYQETIDGKDLTRRQVISFVIMLERDIKAGNPQCYAVDFAGSSKRAGRILFSDLNTFVNTPRNINGKVGTLPSTAAAYAFNPKEEQFTEGSAWVKNLTHTGFSSLEAVKLCNEVKKFLSSKDSIEYHDAYEEADAVDTTAKKVNHNVNSNVEKGSDVI